MGCARGSWALEMARRHSPQETPAVPGQPNNIYDKTLGGEDEDGEEKLNFLGLEIRRPLVRLYLHLFYFSNSILYYLILYIAHHR